MLFGDLFFGLRQAGVKIGLSEWNALMDALKQGLVEPDLNDFYYVARALLIKNEAHFDIWDQVFSQTFSGKEGLKKDVKQLLDWLRDPKQFAGLTPEQLAALEMLPFEELRKRFSERLKDQKERHDGGNRFVGTGGTSPFGHSGQNPGGIRIGGGGGNRSAVQIADERRFADYRDDRVLDTRAMAVALKKLRKLTRKDQLPELDIEESIDKTCRNAGELTLEFRPPRKNEARVVLMMDTGGSMDPFADLVEQLFSAASQLNHWKKFEAFAFHNCVYEKVYTRISEEKGVPTKNLLSEHPPETLLIMVGDAYMAPYELTERYGSISMAHDNNTPGIVWLHRLKTKFPHAVWLNPIAERFWANSWTIKTVGSVIPMFPLTLRGLDDAVDHLLKGQVRPPPDLDPRWTGGFRI